MSTRNEDINVDTVDTGASINCSPSLPSPPLVIRRFPPLVLLSCSDRRHSSRLGLLIGFSSPINASSRLGLLLACCGVIVLQLLVTDRRFFEARAAVKLLFFGFLSSIHVSLRPGLLVRSCRAVWLPVWCFGRKTAVGPPPSRGRGPSDLRKTTLEPS